MTEPRFKTVAEVKEVADFSKYLHSERRETSIVTLNHPLSLQERLDRVTQADYDNWKVTKND